MKRRAGKFVVAGMLVLLGGCGRGHRGQANAEVTALNGTVAPLLEAFNAAAGRPRVLLIVSPT